MFYVKYVRMCTMYARLCVYGVKLNYHQHQFNYAKTYIENLCNFVSRYLTIMDVRKKTFVRAPRLN